MRLEKTADLLKHLRSPLRISHVHYNSTILTNLGMSEHFVAKRAEAEQMWGTFDDIGTKVESAKQSVSEVRTRLKNLYDISMDAYETAKQAESELSRLTSLSGHNDDNYESILQKLETTSTQISQLEKNVNVAMASIERRKMKIDSQLTKTNAARTKAQEARGMAQQAMNESTDAMKLLRIIQDAIRK